MLLSLTFFFLEKFVELASEMDIQEVVVSYKFFRGEIKQTVLFTYPISHSTKQNLYLHNISPLSSRRQGFDSFFFQCSFFIRWHFLHTQVWLNQCTLFSEIFIAKREAPYRSNHGGISGQPGCECSRRMLWFVKILNILSEDVGECPRSQTLGQTFTRDTKHWGLSNENCESF